MRALVTGGAGFIGSHLVDRLLAGGHRVTVVDNLVTGSRANLAAAERAGARFTFVDQDITRPPLAAAVADARPDVVFHLAAQMDVRVSVREPVYDASVNVVGTVNVLAASAAAGARKVVFTSSGGCIYGPPDATPVSEEFPARPHSPYGAAKLSAETYLETYRLLAGLDYVSLALGNVYGPRQNPAGEAGVVAIFAAALLEGRPTTIFGDGAATRDYVHVDDVVEALLAAADAGRPRRYNIGSGVATSVRELHTLIAGLVGAADAPQPAPARPGELEAITLDCALAAAELGWRPRWSLEDGLRATTDWVAAQVGHTAVTTEVC